MIEQNPPIRATEAKRRSSRVVHSVPLVITRPHARTTTIIEKSATHSINCHGCVYFSRYRAKKGEKINLQVTETKEDHVSTAQPLTARVAWVRKSRRLDNFYQVGVEFESPQNIWPVEKPPEDWESFSPAPKENPATFLIEVERLLNLAKLEAHYHLLDVQRDTPHAEVKQHFYRLARRFHPDRHMDHPEWTPQLLALMDGLNDAYRILSDHETKRQYDARLCQVQEQKSSERNRMAREYLENARECLAEKNYIGSIVWLRRAIEHEPNSSSYRAMLAQSLASVPEYRREAVEQFEEAIELDPSNLTAHLHYARMLEQLKLPWRARPHYFRVLELDMNNKEARDRLNLLDVAAPRPASRQSFLRRLTGRRP